MNILFMILIIALMCDVLMSFILNPFLKNYKGYSHTKKVMSVLGSPNSPVKYFYRLWLVFFGILLLIFTIELQKIYVDTTFNITTIIVILIFIFAISACILSGIFSVNEDKKTITLSSKIHGVGSVLGFVSLIFVPLFFSYLLYESNDLLGMVLSLLSFIFALIFFVLLLCQINLNLGLPS